VTDYKKEYPELKAWQVHWCQWFESITGFDVLFDDGQAFEEAQAWNLAWFEDWTVETLGALRHGLPSQAKTRKR
jgi:hypothetical protein